MEFILLLYLFYQLKDHIENNGNQDSMTLLSFIKYLFSSIHFDYFFRFLGMKISLSSVSKYDEDEESEVQLYMSFVFSSTMDCSSSSLLQILKDSSLSSTVDLTVLYHQYSLFIALFQCLSRMNCPVNEYACCWIHLLDSLKIYVDSILFPLQTQCFSLIQQQFSSNLEQSTFQITNQMLCLDLILLTNDQYYNDSEYQQFYHSFLSILQGSLHYYANNQSMVSESFSLRLVPISYHCILSSLMDVQQLQYIQLNDLFDSFFANQMTLFSSLSCSSNLIIYSLLLHRYEEAYTIYVHVCL